jgi:hypothetical protein
MKTPGGKQRLRAFLLSHKLLKNMSPVGVLNLLRGLSPAKWQPGGDNPNKFGTPALSGEDPSHNPMFFYKALDTSTVTQSALACLQVEN